MVRVFTYRLQGCGFHPQQCKIRDITTGIRYPRAKYLAITMGLFGNSETKNENSIKIERM